MEPVMQMLTPLSLLLLIVIAIFALGVITFLAGVLILSFRTGNKDIKTLAVQTANLAQKGIAEDVAGLVGNATNLLEATNDLVRTSKGVGVFLSLLGILLMAAACWLAIQILRSGL
jgi:hypothetical protein